MDEAMKLASSLRDQGIGAVLAPSGKSLKGQMRHASALKARYTLILGEDEVKQGTVVLRDMALGEQESVAVVSLARRLSGDTG